MALTAGMKKDAGTLCRSSSSSTRGSPCVAPNSPAERSTGALLLPESVSVSLSTSKFSDTATLAPLGHCEGVSLRPARTGATEAMIWSRFQRVGGVCCPCIENMVDPMKPRPMRKTTTSLVRDICVLLTCCFSCSGKHGSDPLFDAFGVDVNPVVRPVDDFRIPTDSLEVLVCERAGSFADVARFEDETVVEHER